ncbi:MAG TPA: NADPH:quinone reductase [Jatrophihabitantaceae bacterium]|jgi:NADPH2:quinone reductase
MRAVIYSENGPSDVLQVVDRPIPEPGPGEVRVRMRVSGVNPTDWKVRAGTPPAFPEQVPNQDGAGVIDAVGPGVDPARVGERVWVWLAAHQRPGGTAQEYATLPSERAVPLPDTASFDLGASLGVPFVTAHRTLTVNEHGPQRLAAGVLDGRCVLVAGGAGAVGNAAIQLAHWAGATVLTTVSSAEKAALATAAGAQHVINYRSQDVVDEVRRIAPDGVDTIVEVSPSTNAAIDVAVLGRHGTVAIYAGKPDEELAVPLRPLMTLNARWQFVLLYTLPEAGKVDAVAGVSAAVAAGAVDVGEQVGLPLHRFPLEQTAAAHDAVEGGAVGKVLIEIG